MEHEVSVISALQAAAAMNRGRYRPVPVYVTKSGTWLTGEALLDLSLYKDLDAVDEAGIRVVPERTPDGRVHLVELHPKGFFAKPRMFPIDVAFLGLHGSEGENGSMQGLFETLNLPYTGSGVFGSALGMDKAFSKMICRDQGVPVVDFVQFKESEWAGREDDWLTTCEARLGYPMIVKPARLGSSIGISKADDRAELDRSIEEAFRFDEKVVVEYAVRQLREVNCAVLGDPNEAIASVVEEPVRSEGEELLSYEEKYQRGGGQGKQSATKAPSGDAGMASLDRLIPAPLSDERTVEVRELAVRVFQAFECAGVARIDFMIDEATDQLYFNEINTIPGSFSFYLWEPSGVPFDELTHRMIDTALRRHRDKNGRVRSYDTNLLSERSAGGLKGKG